MRRRLAVSLDDFALLRQSRRSRSPDPVLLAGIAEAAGAAAIVVHLREDRRHIQERDLRILRQTVRTHLCLRVAATSDMLKLAYDIKPDEVILVPQATDDLRVTGFDAAGSRDHARKFVQALRDADIGVRMFIDPDLDQVRAAHRAAAAGVVLDTAKIAEAVGETELAAEHGRLADAARTAHQLGMGVAAGGGLDVHNLENVLDIAEIGEIHVGHAMAARALVTGLERAVRDFAALIQRPAG